MNETALKERLKVIAKAKGLLFNDVWKQLLLERFLARLSRSPHYDHFIFKGGLLLAQKILIGRETTDIDLLMTRLQAERASIEAAFREIANHPHQDGFSFSLSAVEELAQPHMDYPGFRVTVQTRLGKMRDQIQIDVGVGDTVEPIQATLSPFEYKGKPIFEGEITLLTYPVETIFAEKLETIISKGAINSRMKDYHDVILMTREDNLLDRDALSGAIDATFSNRGTKLNLPIAFDDDGREILNRLWAAHLAGLGAFRTKLGLPDTIEAVLAEISSWLSESLPP